MITFSNIVDKFETFVENHFFLKTFSYGSPSDLDLDKFEQYPLLHLVYTSGSYSEKTKQYSFEVYILDCPRGEEDRKEFEKDVITQSEMCAEDIIADLENGGNIFNFDYHYQLESATTTPLEEENSNVLSGTMLNISIAVPYLYDACNAPLSGVSPMGSSTTYSARGLLRVKEVDGVPDVTTVKTITVPDGSLTDDGNGEISLAFEAPDNGKVSKVDYSNPGNAERYVNSSGGVHSGFVTVAPYTEVTFTNRILYGIQYVTQFSLSRREFHGLGSGTTFYVAYVMTVVYDGPGIIAITSTTSQVPLTLTLFPTGIGTETHNLSGQYTSMSDTFVYANLQVLSTVNCTVTINSFKSIITNPA